MEQYVLVAFNGVSWAMTVFLVAAGLTLVFGILHVLNFAHGGFVMLGSYLAYSILAVTGESSLALFIGVSLLSALALGLMGAFFDRLVLRRLRVVSESYSLIATYAVLLLCEGLVKLCWGEDFRSTPPPAELTGALTLSGVPFPSFVIFIIVCGLVTFAVLDCISNRTTLGKTVMSVAKDPWMASLLGINVGIVLTGTVVVGVALAGLAGGLLSVNQSLSPGMGSALIIQAFGVIIVGGMGNVRGAFLASLLLGLMTALGDNLLPDIPGLFFYVALVTILLWRPKGLLKGLH